MKLSYKDILKLVISLALTALVVVSTSRDLEWERVTTALAEFRYGWIFLSIALSLLSHWLRAYRWKLMLATQSHSPSTFTTFLALMIGYLANMAIPRLGEVARCTVLNNQEKIPISFSLGTVVTDRLLDLFMLALLSGFLLLIEFGLVGDYFLNFVNEKAPFLLDFWPLLLAAAILGLISVIWLIKKAHKSEDQHSVPARVGLFIKSMISGVKAIKEVDKPFLFWLSTFAIWALYFLMLYVISFGFDPTDDLSLMAGVAVLVMGSLGMATPVNNGIGAYQAFVANILVLYGIQYEDGYVFAVISHGSQVVSVTIVGFISLMILNFRKRRNQVVENQSENSKSASA